MKDWFCSWVADWLPHRIVYFAAVRLMAHASIINAESVMDDLSPADCLKAWDK